MERMIKIFGHIDMPSAFNEELKSQILRLQEAREDYGKEIISPFDFLVGKIV